MENSFQWNVKVRFGDFLTYFCLIFFQKYWIWRIWTHQIKLNLVTFICAIWLDKKCQLLWLCQLSDRIQNWTWKWLIEIKHSQIWIWSMGNTFWNNQWRKRILLQRPKRKNSAFCGGITYEEIDFDRNFWSWISVCSKPALCWRIFWNVSFWSTWIYFDYF